MSGDRELQTAEAHKTVRINLAQQFELVQAVNQQASAKHLSTKQAAKMAVLQNNMQKKLTPQIMQKYKSIQ